ncbi:hypothetical protein AB0M11_06645 [Streptomyces sp. NPDC051987]|uniref:hypothetical protein n=1 Tax=Streptomyces sp. NPDC051987 TaxID=3155808 RepID=UPI00341DB3CD
MIEQDTRPTVAVVPLGRGGRGGHAGGILHAPLSINRLALTVDVQLVCAMRLLVRTGSGALGRDTLDGTALPADTIRAVRNPVGQDRTVESTSVPAERGVRAPCLDDLTTHHLAVNDLDESP